MWHTLQTTYTVRPGDSLYTIARQFNTTVDAIMRANNLSSDVIYPGQQLTIPGTDQGGRGIIRYTVQAGDSLFSIAQRFNTTIESIMDLNGLSSTQLAIGQTLIIPQYTEVVVQSNSANIRQGPGTNYNVIATMVRGARLPVTASTTGWYRVRLHDGRQGWISANIVQRAIYDGSKPITTILGFYTQEEGPALPSSYNSFVNNTSVLSEVGLFYFRISRDNPTQIEKFGTFTDQEVADIVNIAHQNNVKALGVIHNLLYERGNTTVSKDVVRQMLSTQDNRRTFTNNVLELIRRYNFDGVNIDIEDVYLEDSDLLSAFYTELGAALHQNGYYFSASIPSRTSDQPTNPFSAPFNYSVIGRAVDEFVVMLYNEHGWPGSGPGPVVSIGWMNTVLNYTMTKMPKEKIVGAVSVFGFDFNLTTGRNTYVTYPMAMQLAAQYNQQVIFDQATQTPMFSYQDAQGNQHEVWFENAQSIRAKIQLAWDLGIKGVALWRLGMEDPAVWTMLRNDVVVRKD